MNLLFGFVPEDAFERGAPALSAATAAIAPFDARLEGVHSFGHREDATVWLDPAAADEEPWARLRSTLETYFPRCRGRREGYTPHLSLGRTHDPHALAAACAARLDAMPAKVGELALLSRRGDEPMRVRATVALGTGEMRWTDEAPDPALPGPPDDDESARRTLKRLSDALADGVVHLVGSRRMGCALPGADLDLVAALPGSPDPAKVRARVAAALPEATGLRQVIGARVPGLRLRADGLDVDLVVVGTGSLPADEAVERRAELGDAAAVALSAVSDAEAVATTAGEHPEAFARLAREVKAWARARGLDSAPFGGLPGLGWAVLAAHTVREAGALPPAGLLRHFFATWAAWNWSEPVGGPGTDLPVTVMTPSAPVRPCTEQISAGGRDLLTRELFRAWETVESTPGPWPGLLAPPPLHRRHRAWAVVTVAPGPHEGRVRGRMRALLTALEDAGATDLHAWPRPFTTDPVRYAIGLGSTPPDRARLAEIADRWLRGLPGTTLTRGDNGDVPTLR